MAAKPLPKVNVLRGEGKIAPDNSRAIAVPEPLIVAEKVSDLEPTVTLIETVPPETVPVTRSGLVGTGA